jgi:ATP-binding cassette subfamily C protein LapB
LSNTYENNDDIEQAKAQMQSDAEEQQNLAWPLQADRIALKDPLLECLQVMAGHYGRRISSNALIAGLPVPKSGITPTLFVRASERADLSARLVTKTLPALAIAPNLPCILILEGGQACILKEIKTADGSDIIKSKKGKKSVDAGTLYVVSFPETPDENKDMTLKDLAPIYTGNSFFIRPTFRADDRAGPALLEKGRDWFWSALRANKSIYVEVMLGAVFINIFALISPLFVMNVYDRVVPNNAVDTLWVLAIGVTIAYFFDFMLKNLRSMFLDVAGRRADVKMSSDIFEQVLGMKLSQRPGSAGVLTSTMREFETVRDFFTSATMVTLIDLPFAFMFVLVMYILGGPIALVPAIIMPLVVLIGLYYQRKLKDVIKESMAENALKSALMFETVTGLETIKVQAAESHTQRRWEELTDKASYTGVKIRRISSHASHWAMFLQQMASVAIIIIGTYLIAAGDVSMGALIACVILSGRALAPLGQIAGLLTRMNQSKESLEQLNDLMSKDVERPKDKHFISVPQAKGRVEFRDVTFHYPDQSVPALNKANLIVQPGEHIGIIGAVGSGKTTLQRLLMNLYEPDSGTIMLDETDVRQVDPGDLRRNIGVVQQRPMLFYGSVRENITMGHETAPERAVLRAAELSGVMEFLRDTQHGLDTQVGERGEALSGGQQQAVAVARALLYDPPVMILDEPTASMDPASENRLMRRLHAITRDRTMVLITHKGSMLQLCSRLILMDRGRILADGPKEEILKRLQTGEFKRSIDADQEKQDDKKPQDGDQK